MLLKEILVEKIKQGGPMSFCDFMDMALYYPGLGYYNSEKNKIGKQGDYYTSPVLSSVFGEMLGRQMEEMWFLLGKKPFTIVEYGAGTGALCFDLLNYLKRNADLYEHLNYCIIEKSSTMQVLQKSFLKEKVSWHNSIDEIPNLNGCVISNELLDNFAVHKVVMREELMEVFVDYQDEFIEVPQPANDGLKNYFAEQQILLPKDYSTEVNLQALDWIQEIAANLQTGFVLTIDYGFPAFELYDAKRNTGTLVCFKNHEVNYAPYENIGMQDITVHVNFSAVKYWGEKAGLLTNGFTTQDHFLRSLGLMGYLRNLEMENKKADQKEFIFQINKLVEMGNKFKVLIQQKGTKKSMLTGLQFSSPMV
jgi:SAM-dependent MidA family methyltransferase